MISKDIYGVHIKAFEFTLSFMPNEQIGWSGGFNSFKVRLLNERLHFPKSYWFSIGKGIHSHTYVSKHKIAGIEKERDNLRKHNIKTGYREPK